MPDLLQVGVTATFCDSQALKLLRRALQPFESMNDKRGFSGGIINKLPGGSWGLVGLILLILLIWMATGLGADKNAESTEAEAAAAAPRAKLQVLVREQHAATVSREVAINGDTQPDQIINLAAQVDGQVVAIGARKGARVKLGDLIARVDGRDLAQHKNAAAALVKQRELEHQAAQKLLASGHITPSEAASRLAALEAARSSLKDAQFQITHLNIVAPVAGILEDQHVEVGDYAKVGSPIARIIVIDPLRVSGGVNEQDIRLIQPGDAASAELSDGEKLTGTVRFISSLADSKSRTFTVEVAVANPEGRIPAGLTARVAIPVEEISAHRIPASLLSLADDGAIGVKFVGADDKVVFVKAGIVRADGDAVWVSGLPERIRLITRGQGFVNAGEAVTVETEAAPSSDAKSAAAAS
jgi:multidrug efflux system membrane fusion protein